MNKQPTNNHPTATATDGSSILQNDGAGTALERLQRLSFERLEKLFGGSLEDLPKVAESERPGYMPLHFDTLAPRPNGCLDIALAHYFKAGGDLVSDPDMEARIDYKSRRVLPLAYQDTMTYSRAYRDEAGTVPDKPREWSLNSFLATWLGNCLAQGHALRTLAGASS